MSCFNWEEVVDKLGSNFAKVSPPLATYGSTGVFSFSPVLVSYLAHRDLH